MPNFGFRGFFLNIFGWMFLFFQSVSLMSDPTGWKFDGIIVVGSDYIILSGLYICEFLSLSFFFFLSLSIARGIFISSGFVMWGGGFYSLLLFFFRRICVAFVFRLCFLSFFFFLVFVFVSIFAPSQTHISVSPRTGSNSLCL